VTSQTLWQAARAIKRNTRASADCGGAARRL